MVGVGGISVVSGHSWLRIQHTVGLAVCGSLQIVIRLEEQGAGRFGWSVWIGDQLVILSSSGSS